MIMNQKERKMQEALGLLKTYTGYITTDPEDSNEKSGYIVYEIKAPTLKSAKHRLKSVCAKLSDAEETEYRIAYMCGPGDPRPDSCTVIETRCTIV